MMAMAALGLISLLARGSPWALPRGPRASPLLAHRGGESVAGEVAAAFEFYTNDMCPYAQRVWIALEELGVPFVRTPIDLRSKPEWFLRDVNPSGKVPALRDASDGTVHTESLAINEYLADRYSRGGATGLLPTDASMRAQVAGWNEHLDGTLSVAFFTALMAKADDSAPKLAALNRALAHYEDNLVGPYLCGEHFTLADIAAIPFFERLALTLPHFREHDALAPFPRTREWMATVTARPSVAATLRPPEALLELYEMFIGRDYKFGGLNRAER